MFGFSFSELVVVILVAVVVMGPKDLPKMLRRVGQWAGKLRRMAADLRAQSGIDEALRTEGLADDIAEIRKLARGELDAVRVAATVSIDGDRAPVDTSAYARGDDFYVVRDREYPRDGADAYGALPDNAIVYAEGLPKSRHHRDPLYVMGDENAELPPVTEEAGMMDTDVAAAEGPGVTDGAGPTLMGVGVADLEPKPAPAPDGQASAPRHDDVHDALTAKPGEVGPTLMGVGSPLADGANERDDDAAAGADAANANANASQETR